VDNTSKFKDITERKRAEEALWESEAKWRYLVDNATDIITIVDRDGTFLFINRTVPELTPEQVIGTKVYDYITPEHYDTIRESIERVFQTGEACTYELAGVGPQGTTSWYHTRVGPIKDDGEVVAAMQITTDITEHNRVEEALRQAQAELERRVEERTAKLARINEELHSEITERKRAEDRLKESEERFRALVESTSDWVWEVDANAVYTYASPKVKDLLGYEPEEIIGKTPFELMYPESAKLIAAEFKAIAEAQKPFERLENINLHRGGRLVVLETSGVPIFDANGDFRGYRGIDRDITERKHAEEALQKAHDELEMRVKERTAELTKANEELQIEIIERKHAEEALIVSEAQLQHLLTSSPAVIYTCRPAGDYGATFISENIKMQFGYEPREFTDNSQFWADHIHPEDAPRIFAELPRLFEEDRHTYEYRFKNKEGTYRWMRDEMRLICDADGNPLEIIGYWIDITERKEAEEHLQNTLKELQKKNEALEKATQELKETTAQLVQSEKLSALGELTAGMADELNQPLNGIKIISQSILRDIQKDRFEEEELEQYLGDLVSQVNEMAELIDHMRIFNRRTEGMPREMVDVNMLIEGAFKFLGQQLKNHNIEVVRELSADLPPVVGDSIRLEKVVMNFITNARDAVKSSQKDHKSIEIRTYQVDGQTSEMDNHAVVLEVTDNGIGIPEDLRQKIFEPFFTTKEPGKGTGLGLSVASKIIEEHNGRIELSSQVGEGTTFRVILPTAD